MITIRMPPIRRFSQMTPLNSPALAMTDIKWHFREMKRNEMNENIELGELLPDEPTDARLVREVIQNSLDASVSKVNGDGQRSKENPVKVRFSLAGLANPLPAEPS